VVHLPSEEGALDIHACGSQHLLEGCSHETVWVESNLSKSVEAVLALSVAIEASNKSM
jgi:hypothetical protein